MHEFKPFDAGDLINLYDSQQLIPYTDSLFGDSGETWYDQLAGYLSIRFQHFEMIIQKTNHYWFDESQGEYLGADESYYGLDRITYSTYISSSCKLCYRTTSSENISQLTPYRTFYCTNCPIMMTWSLIAKRLHLSRDITRLITQYLII